LFPDWETGVKRVLAVIQSQQISRRRKGLPLAG
jgi:hypothetical protein